MASCCSIPARSTIMSSKLIPASLWLSKWWFSTFPVLCALGCLVEIVYKQCWAEMGSVCLQMGEWHTLTIWFIYVIIRNCGNSNAKENDRHWLAINFFVPSPQRLRPTHIKSHLPPASHHRFQEKSPARPFLGLEVSCNSSHARVSKCIPPVTSVTAQGCGGSFRIGRL